MTVSLSEAGGTTRGRRFQVDVRIFLTAAFTVLVAVGNIDSIIGGSKHPSNISAIFSPCSVRNIAQLSTPVLRYGRKWYLDSLVQGKKVRAMVITRVLLVIGAYAVHS